MDVFHQRLEQVLLSFLTVKVLKTSVSYKIDFNVFDTTLHYVLTDLFSRFYVLYWKLLLHVVIMFFSFFG